MTDYDGWKLTASDDAANGKAEMQTLSGDIEIDCPDDEPWRSYHFETQGRDMDEAIENLDIIELGKTGEDMGRYGLEDASEEIARYVWNELSQKY